MNPEVTKTQREINKEEKEKFESAANPYFILSDKITAYNKHLRNPQSLKDYNERTITETMFELLRFNKYLAIYKGTLAGVTYITKNDIMDYIKFCQEILRNKTNTINKKLRAIRQFFDFLVKHYHALTFNAALDVAYLDESKVAPPQFIPRGHLRRITDKLAELKYGVRDVCITKLIAYTGLKLNEVFALNVEDINISDREIYIKRAFDVPNNAKKKADYIIFPIVDSLIKDLRDYQELRKELFQSNNPSNSFFLSHTGAAYSERAYQYKFKEALIESGIEERYSPRHVRATFCYYMAQKVDEGKLKKILNQRVVTQYFEPKENPNKMMEILENPIFDETK